MDAAGRRLDADPCDNAVTTPRVSRDQGGRRVILSVITLDHEAPEDGTRAAAFARAFRFQLSWESARRDELRLGRRMADKRLCLGSP
jgi:hypothetical protein